MKRLEYFLFILLCQGAFLLTTACQSSGNRTNSRNANATDSIIDMTGSNAPELYRAGAYLISGNDCFTCHSVDSAVKGPAFKKIAQKYHHYEGVLSNLTNGIINGSKGIWGDQEMTPHPNLSHADARKMVLYIFSLDSTHVHDTTGTRQVK